jgi:hypothetical protein
LSTCYLWFRDNQTSTSYKIWHLIQNICEDYTRLSAQGLVFKRSFSSMKPSGLGLLRLGPEPLSLQSLIISLGRKAWKMGDDGEL